MERFDRTTAVSAHAPRVLPGLLSRTRLTEAMLPLAAITVVRGPGGAGKTMLLSQLVAQLPEERGAWVTAEEGKLTRTAFWHQVLSCTLGRDAADRALGEKLVDATRVVDALRAAAERLVIVVDDAHLFLDQAIFRDILHVARAVPVVSFLLATRTRISELEDPAEALSLDIKLMRPEELQFNVEEIAAFAAVSTKRAQEVHDLTGGNALLLRALQLGARRNEGDVAGDAIEILRAYLDRYVASVDRELVSFMQRTALGDDFSLAEANDVSGHPRPEEPIDALEAAGLLTRQQMGAQERFRYHPLVRDYLRREAATALPDDIAKLHGIVARHRAERGDRAAALQHALYARDFDLAAKMLLLGGTDLLRETPYEAFTNVPVRVAAHHPLLAASRALKENARGSRWVAREYFAAALLASKSIAVRNTPERATMVVLESVAARLHGRSKEAAAAAHRALSLIDRLGSDSLLGAQVFQLMSMCAVSFFRAGDLDGLWKVLDQVPIDSPRGGLVCASLAAVTAAAAGDLPELERIERSIERSGWRRQELVGYRGALLQLAGMLRDLAKADTESVRLRMNEMDEHLPTLEYRVLFAAVHAISLVIDGEPQSARLHIDEVRRDEAAAQRLSPRDADLITIVDALAAAADGWVGAARKGLESVSSSSRWGRLLRAHLDLLQGDHVSAARHLAAPALADVGEARLERARLLMLAWTGMESGETDATRAALISAAGIVRASGEDGSLMLIPADVRARLADSVDEGELGACVREQLGAPLPSPFSSVPLHPRLTKRELVVLAQLQSRSRHAEIAEVLGISPNTVKTQLRSAYRKLGAADRDQALVRMAVLGIHGSSAESDRERRPDAARDGHPFRTPASAAQAEDARRRAPDAPRDGARAAASPRS